MSLYSPKWWSLDLINMKKSSLSHSPSPPWHPSWSEMESHHNVFDVIRTTKKVVTQNITRFPHYALKRLVRSRLLLTSLLFSFRLLFSRKKNKWNELNVMCGFGLIAHHMCCAHDVLGIGQRKRSYFCLRLNNYFGFLIETIRSYAICLQTWCRYL